MTKALDIDLQNLLQNVKPLSLKYAENQKKQNFDIGFNLFELISDHYYRETFHSNILSALIDPKGKHGHRDEYLRLFLEFIASQHEAKVDPLDYTNAEVTREEGRMDILIKGSKHAILIENKINGAVDQYRQLPNYLKTVEDHGYTCDAIIYLRLNGDAGPDMTGWTEDEKSRMNKLLKVICAHDGADDEEKDLLRGWIKKCKEQSKDNSDAQHILNQYSRIIEKLGRQVMNNPAMDEFYKIIISDDNFKTASLLKAMLDKLPEYRVERIVNEFKKCPAPFERVIRWSNGAIFERGFGQAKFQMNIWALPELYLFELKDEDDKFGTVGQARAILEKMESLEKYDLIAPENRVYRFKKQFVFPAEEAALMDHIRDFKSELKKVLTP